MMTGMINTGKTKFAPWIMLNAAKLENSFFLYFAAILKIGEDSNNNGSKSTLNNFSMQSNPQQDPYSHDRNDDLDLLAIARNVVFFLKTNAKQVALASLAGLFCGVILHFSLPKYYTSGLLLESVVMSNTEARELVANWNGLLRPSGYPYLKKEFNCSTEVVENILSLSAEPLNAQNESLPGLSLTVSVRDTTRLKDLQTALLNGFKNNDYIRRRVEFHRQGAINQIRKTDEELRKLDSTKDFLGSVEDLKKDKSSLILDISNLSMQKVNLVERKDALVERLEFIDGVLLIEGFGATKGPKPGWIVFLTAGLAGGFFLGYLVLLLRTLNRKISKPKTN